MSRIKDIRIERSVSIVNVRGLESIADHMITHPHLIRPSEILPHDAPGRLARRAIFFHQFITDFRRTGNQQPPAEARVCPPQACINSYDPRDRRRPAEEEKGTNEQVSNTSPSVTSVSGPGTGAGTSQNGTPVQIRLTDIPGWAETDPRVQ